MPTGMQDFVKKMYFSIGDVPVAGRTEPKVIRKIKDGDGTAPKGSVLTTFTTKEGQIHEVAASDYIEGRLKQIVFKEQSWKGSPSNKFQFVLTDAQGSVEEILETGESSMIVGDILNRLAAAMPAEGPFTGWVRITPYKSEFVNDQKETVAYTHAAIRVDGEKIQHGKYKKEERPAINYIPIPGKKPAKDDSALIAFWRKIADDINARLPVFTTDSAVADDDGQAGNAPDASSHPVQERPAVNYAPF